MLSLPRLILVQTLNVSSDVARSCTIRESTKQDRARQSTRAPFPHITTNTEMLKQTNKERKATQDVTAPHRKVCNVGLTRTHKRIRDSQFRCCLFQAIVKSSCLGILWQSRFAHDLQVSRSVSSAEHDSRQLSWRTRGLTRRTKNHGTSLGEASGAFRRNTVYHVTSSTKSDGVSEPVCCVQMHPPWQEQMTEKKKTLVERYALQTNTNTDGRVESCDTGQPTSDHEKQMMHNFT